MSDKTKTTKVLCLFDSPTVNTGFGVLSRNLLRELSKIGGYEFDIIGINYHGDWYDPAQFPNCRIIPATINGAGDMYGRDKLILSLVGQIYPFSQPYDIVFTIQDHFILEEGGFVTALKGIQEAITDPTKAVAIAGSKFVFAKSDKKLKWVAYWPVDSELKENWVRDVMQHADVPVSYSNYGYGEAAIFNNVLKNEFPKNIIYHGVDTETFKPLKRSKQFRQEFFKGKINESDFLITNVNRNQMRKDIPSTLKVFAEVKKQIPNAKLYLHMRTQDDGGNLHEYANFLGLKRDKEYFTQDYFDTSKGVAVEVLNQIYNASDLIITTTLGEGWGFSLTESMAAGVPIIAPHNTTVPELFNTGGECPTVEDYSQPNEFRGIAANVLPRRQWVTAKHDAERFRPPVDVDDMVEKIVWVFENKDTEKVKAITERANKWVKTITWQKIAKQWHELFQNALNS